MNKNIIYFLIYALTVKKKIDVIYNSLSME